jgi:hypothetical protein
MLTEFEITSYPPSSLAGRGLGFIDTHVNNRIDDKHSLVKPN